MQGWFDLSAPKRIGILTNGGNYVGLNAAIRAVALYQAVEPSPSLGPSALGLGIYIGI